ncbi:deoxyribodipyrimidine photolyase [Arenimonas sp.]|nr:deoxyribodipyrimidine photolyase [Candidatus Parcubacteria bacterium]
MNPYLTYNEILEIIDAFNPATYSKTRNHLRGCVSRLSPYIARGVISLPVIRDRVLARHSKRDAQKFVQELAWREYFQKVYKAKGKKIFSDLRFTRTDWRNNEVLSAVLSAQTGIIAVDLQLAELMEHGYMHNHARMWTAMLSCNVAKTHWYNMSRFMYYHLLDGDLASNTLSWQWVAGTSVQKQYVANQELINGCSDTKQQHTYIDVPIDLINQGGTPSELVDHEPFSYKMLYPESDIISDVSHKTVFLYHPWSIDPLWRTEELGERIFVIEPRLFDLFPVSPRVLEHMLRLLKTHVPTVNIFVGNVETIPGITNATVFSVDHPATTHFIGHKDPTLELFPNITGYYPSFFKFWQACEESNDNAL